MSIPNINDFDDLNLSPICAKFMLITYGIGIMINASVILVSIYQGFN